MFICRFRGLITALSIFATTAALPGWRAYAQDNASVLAIGDAVATSLSGVVEPDQQEPLLTAAQTEDETFLDLAGISARINFHADPGFVWDARVWPAHRTWESLARDIGQVFSVALYDAEKPNICLTASSAYGLHIVQPDKDGDGRPERLRLGAADALFQICTGQGLLQA